MTGPAAASAGSPAAVATAALNNSRPGHFGPYGGRFAPEALMSALDELAREYAAAQADPAFQAELTALLTGYAGRPTLVITPTIDLMNQWYDELAMGFGGEIGLLGGGYYDIRPLTVTTYDSAYLNMDRLGNRFGFIVFDECHHLPGPTYGLAATCAIAPYRMGLTATPERADNAHTHLDQLIGPIVYRREITQLRGQYLADYRVMTLYVNLSDDERGRY